MSFDTDKQRLYKIWNKSLTIENQIENVKLIQDNKEKQIKLSESNNSKFKTIRSFNSEWTPIAIKGQQNDGSYSYRGVSFVVELTLPEIYIPFARLNLAYRYMGDENIFDATTLLIIQFMQVIDAESKNEFGLPITTGDYSLKRVRYNLAFTQGNFNTVPVWYDYEMKLFLTLINPQHITAS